MIRAQFLSLAGLLLATSLPASLVAQNALGTTELEGREVVIFDDKTWRYADEGNGQPCQTLPLNVSFCGLNAGWVENPPPSPNIAAQYRFGDRVYGQYVIEALGSDDGIEHTYFRKAIITNAANGAGVAEEDVDIQSLKPDELAGHPSETVTYQLDFDGLEVVFINTITILPKMSLQTMTFSVGTTVSDEHRSLDAAFKGHTVIK